MEQEWGFTNIWNESLVDREERERLPRNHLWAGELGKAPIDLYLRLKGVPASNPPNDRSKRKFEAGNVWEWIVKLILIRTGILVAEQKHIKHQYPGLLEVTGRLDFIAGGVPDYNKAKEELEKLTLPDVFLRAGRNIIQHLEKHYPAGLDPKVLEIKSTSSFMFDVYQGKHVASKNHRIQNFHYLKGLDMPRGSVVYVCRDDCRMVEIPVLNPSKIEDEYKGFIERITYYVNKGEEPPKEQLIEFDEEAGKFTKNWKVAYSEYLTMLYGFENQKAYDDIYSKMASRFNRVVKRIAEGKNMTKKNEDALNEIKGQGFDPDYCASKFSLKGESDEEE